MAFIFRYTFFLLTIAFVLNIGCSTTEDIIPQKSKLVQSIEGIFYADDFTSIASNSINANEFGAIGDSTTLNTEAIQSAIDAAAKAGGGKVVFAPGIYLSGALFIKSNVELHLAKGVTIRAIQDDAHYPEKPTRVAGFEMSWPSALINVYEENNVRITGEGTIDGNGKYWWDKFWGDPPRSGGMWLDYKKKNVRWAVDYDCKRVRAVVIYKSSDVLLRDLSILRSGFWTVSLTYSKRVHVDGITIRNNIGGFGPSSDGINTDSSSEILVENCDIDCNDDNLCIKAGRDADGLRVNRPSENIVYRNCVTRAGHGLFTIGSETSGGMRNIEIYGLEAKGTSTGIRFKSAQVRGGVIENISFHDIKMQDVKKPFHFELNWYPEYSYPTIPAEFPESEIKDSWRMMTTKVIPAERGIPEFKNLKFENIDVKGAEVALYANAYSQKSIHDLTWKNVSIQAEKGGSISYGENWSMDDVNIVIPDDQKIKITGSKNIELPNALTEVIISEEEAIKSKRISLKASDFLNNNKDQSIVAINPITEKLIQTGDSTTFSKTMNVFISPKASSQISYVEPLGDGFYMTPIIITYNHSTNTIAVVGEKEHQYTFHLLGGKKPNEIKDADQWDYKDTEKQLVIQKTAANLEITIN